ncbi:MAG: dipeptide ABC transporter ATP-binding protein [Pseudomonadota bacterium]
MLAIKDLSLSIGGTPILKDIDLSLEKGRILGVVGESGSGKSMTALSAMQLLPEGSVTSGSIMFEGHSLLGASDTLMQDLRGDDIAMIFQEPMTALNPVHTIGDQIAEGIILHDGAGRQEAETRVHELLNLVGLPPERFPLSRYPHELSGGQRQRVMIAMACAQRPSLLIADEPTTALDVTLQAQILRLLRDLVEQTGMGLMLISHDLAVVAEVTDDIVVIRDGRVLDAGPTGSVLRELKHPYTRQLAEASSHVPAKTRPPVLTADQERVQASPMLELRSVSRVFPTRRKSLWRKEPPFIAVDDVSLTVYPGQSIGLVGESGCGKSTLARMILGLDAPTNGTVHFLGTEFHTANHDEIRDVRKNLQVVFQDPFSSFNPRHKVARLVAEPLYLEPELSNDQKHERVVRALLEVGLDESAMDKYPHEFSGGQRQRLAIARALITRPALIVADEPVSALDVSIRAQVLDLLSELRERLNLAYLFISHDLGVVRAICDEVFVMERGRIVEHDTVAQVFDQPKSDAAKALVRATPDLERALAYRKDVASVEKVELR